MYLIPVPIRNQRCRQFSKGFIKNIHDLLFSETLIILGLRKYNLYLQSIQHIIAGLRFRERLSQASERFDTQREGEKEI